MTLNETMHTSKSGWAILVRFLVGLVVFLPEGIQKLAFPALLGHDVGMFHLPADMKRTGFWSAMHESRVDLTMLLGCLYLLIVGAGKWSLDFGPSPD